MRVILVEDSALIRAGLARLLTDRGMEVVAEAADAAGFLAALDRGRPDLAVVDVRLPPTFTDEGIRAAIEARTRHPGLPVLVLSQHVEERYAADLLADRAGGLGYLLKDRVADVGEFVDACRRVAAGGTAVDGEVVAQLMARRRARPVDALSEREREVLALIAEGRTNAAVARRLHVTDGAVEKHVSAIFLKLGLRPGADDHRRVLAVLAWLADPR
ncbi:MAG: response regulator transcription factor [Thermoleophilia bacterium]|nr:response regulator transcription factor [Thermoleophilia bacterium]